MTDRSPRPLRPARSESREALELRALKNEQPALSAVVDMHLELLEVHRRIRARIPLPTFEVNAQLITYHQVEGTPLLRFEDVPLEVSDFRLVFRQAAEILRRFDALEEDESQKVQATGRDMSLLSIVSDWYRAGSGKSAVPIGSGPLRTPAPVSPALDQVLTLTMRPFLSRCAEVLQQHPGLGIWQHSHCALCGGESDFAVITPAAERHLICGRCGLRWKFEPLTCPYCGNSDKSRITSFATPDGRYRVYACDVCSRYLKAYDGRRTSRPVMPIVDIIATMPLDAAAMQRGYSG